MMGPNMSRFDGWTRPRDTDGTRVARKCPMMGSENVPGLMGADAG